MRSSDTEPMALRFCNVVKRFGDALALDDCSFEVRAGEIVGYIGPNGAGKTTSMRILATLLRPDAGAVSVLGEEVERADVRTLRPRIGYMADAPYLNDEMTVAEFLDYGAAMYRLNQGRRRTVVRDTLDLTDLAPMADWLIGRLSRGDRQRLALACTLVHDPEVLLLDEPASGLDPIARVELRELLKVLRRMGKTIFIASHVLSELDEVCDSVLVLSRGRVVASGAIGSLLDTLDQHARLELVFSDEAQALRAEEWLSGRAAVLGWEAVRKGRSLEYSGGIEEQEIEAALAGLIREGVRVIYCHRRRPSLERFYLKTMLESGGTG